ncbi:putative helicase mov-10-B.2 isoform X3 [Epinephelus fuscoguttatus]|uniref:putative helicase mov-10-B.2 isoform X3 n=1 Tax=Epinephelus fuscoguttatus TaxID=293821 RepID=UPI0020D0F55F|nr:putative helicase mov-10-B.2 isoform X3 [Epinephelus fuscoguttatus]
MPLTLPVVCCKDKMSLLHQQYQQPEMLPVWPSAQKTGSRGPGYLNGPHNTSDSEAHMAQCARQHIQTRLHVAKLFQQYRSQPMSSKCDVIITSDPPSMEKKIRLTVYENEKVVPVILRNMGVRTVYITLQAFDLVKNIFTVRDTHGNIIESMKQLPLGRGEAFKLQVHFYSEYAGLFEHLLIFQLETHQQASEKSEIMRLLEITHRTSSCEEPLCAAPKSLCDNRTENPKPNGVRFNWLKLMVPLKGYPMPNSVKDLQKSSATLEKTPLNWKNYGQRLHLLLHLEELQQKTDIEKFNKEDKMFRHKSNKDIFILKVAGDSNSPPERLSRNSVLVSPLDRSACGKNIFKGRVIRVTAEWAYLQFSEECPSDFKKDQKFRFNFIINRTPLRTQHRAVDLVSTHRLREVLFPTGQHSLHSSCLHRLLNLEGNPEQQQAIQHIVAATAKPAPYLVFGPPGTGKTVTLVEAIRQIVETQKSCKILACAPSNNAADHLCEKILEEKICKREVYRLYALSYPVRNIPQTIKVCCNLNPKTDTLMIPAKGTLMRCKILITSLITAGRLVTGGIPSHHYTYIFVDEAGQAAETECIIPLAGLVKPQQCQVVLAGDPKQLGPIITSRVAEKHGLGVSLLERLMNNNNLYKPHEQDGFDNRFVTKLLRNYRSHPAILKIPNELFYNGELQPYAPKAAYRSYLKWEHLPKKGFPLIFHGVAGTDERDANSPSVYNMAEVEVLKEYLKVLVEHLRKNGVTKIEPGEIGIITPYRKQVEKIQKALRTDKDLPKENLENVLVGSVEQFQGKEFNVILVSAVRSNLKLTAKKQRFTIGFLDNEKRFNVAMTRARALLIVIGDPRVLRTDYIWNKLIHYCFTKGGYRGITMCDAKEEEDTQTNVRTQPLGRVVGQLDPC